MIKKELGKIFHLYLHRTPQITCPGAQEVCKGAKGLGWESVLSGWWVGHGRALAQREVHARLKTIQIHNSEKLQVDKQVHP